MHVQRDEYPAFKYAVMDGLYFGQHSGAIGACEIALHQGADFGFPGNAQGVILHQVEYAGVGLSSQALGQGSSLPFQAKRSEEHTSELQSLMRISYAVFCLKTKINTHNTY